MFGPQMNFAPPILQARNRDPRLAYFQALQQQGSATTPVSSPLEAAARVAQAGIGGFFGGKVNQQYEDRQKKYQEALSQAMGQPDPIAALQAVGNPDVLSQFGPQILASKSEDRKFERQRGAAKEDMTAQQQFTLNRDKIQNDYTNARDDLQRAHAKALQDNSFANQAELQKAQQAFAAAQQNASQFFQGQQNQMNRDLQGRVLEQGRIPPGYRMMPDGSLAAIPGSEAAGKAAEKADTTREQAVATDRMIRGVDELINSPGREFGTGMTSIINVIPGTEGATFKAKLETLKSQAFLPAVAQLKGMGALSDSEGRKLTAAIGALEPSMKEEDFLASLQQIKADLLAARARMGGQTQQPQAGAPAPQAGGMKFLGFE